MASFKHLISSWFSTWTCTRQPWWRSPLDVILPMGCMISSSWCKPMETYLTPHRLSHIPWVSTQSAMDNAYHTMGSLDPSRYIFYALWVDQLDSLFDLVLINLSQDQSLGNSLNSTLVITNSPWNQHMYSKKSLWTKPSNITQGNH